MKFKVIYIIKDVEGMIEKELEMMERRVKEKELKIIMKKIIEKS